MQVRILISLVTSQLATEMLLNMLPYRMLINQMNTVQNKIIIVVSFFGPGHFMAGCRVSGN